MRQMRALLRTTRGLAASRCGTSLGGLWLRGCVIHCKGGVTHSSVNSDPCRSCSDSLAARTARRPLHRPQDGFEQLAGVRFVENLADPCGGVGSVR